MPGVGYMEYPSNWRPAWHGPSPVDMARPLVDGEDADFVTVAFCLVLVYSRAFPVFYVLLLGRAFMSFAVPLANVCLKMDRMPHKGYETSSQAHDPPGPRTHLGEQAGKVNPVPSVPVGLADGVKFPPVPQTLDASTSVSAVPQSGLPATAELVSCMTEVCLLWCGVLMLGQLRRRKFTCLSA